MPWGKALIWGNRGEALAPHLTAGKLVYCEGSPDVDAWTTEAGKLRSQVMLNVNPNDRIRFLSNGSKSADTEEVAEDQIPFHARRKAAEIEKEPERLYAAPATWLQGAERLANIKRLRLPERARGLYSRVA